MSRSATDDFAFHIDQLEAEHSTSGKLYYEFLRVPDMSAGLYILPADGEDPQQPHAEDEMYYVVQGRGKFFMMVRLFRSVQDRFCMFPKGLNIVSLILKKICISS